MAVTTAAVVLGLAPVPAKAAVVEVACGDAAALVRAIRSANGSGQATTLDLDGCTYKLAKPAQPGGPNAGGDDGLPVITGKVTIQDGTIARQRGPATPLFRILEVAKGGIVTLNRVTVEGGKIENGNGAGIYVDGRILKNLDHTEQPGTLTLHQSRVRNNTGIGTADDEEILGGGIYSRGTTVVDGSTISDNRLVISGRLLDPNAEAVAEGGGLVNGGTMTIVRSRVVHNHVTSVAENLGAFGGGLGSFSDPDFIAPAFLRISDSVIGWNTVDGRFAEGAAMEIELDTFVVRTQVVGNEARAHADGPRPFCAFGLTQCNSGSVFADGAVLNQGNLTMIDSAIEKNRSTATGSPEPVVQGAGLTNSGTFRVTQYRPFPGRAEMIRTKVRDNVAIATGPGSRVLGVGIANADHNRDILAAVPLILRNSLVTKNTGRAETVHGGGIYNFHNPIVQNPTPPRIDGVVILDQSRVIRNVPDNCEPAGTIAGCTG